jgi:hypothetical protein
MTFEPRMSVVLVTDDYESVRPALDRWLLQTVTQELEVVLVVPSRRALAGAAAGLEGFGAVQVVELGLPLDLGEWRAAGVHAASAPLVFIGETHSYAHPRLAQELMEAHAGPWAVVVPGFRNANPERSLSWAGFLADYSPWASGLPGGEISYAPIYNAAYRRSVLLEFGDRLGSALSQGDELLTGLRARRHRIYIEPAATIKHFNLSRPTAFLRERFLTGLLIAARRARRWSWRHRLAYVCGSPLLPVVYLSRVRIGVRTVRRNVPLGAFPALLVGALVKAAGEMIGYARGAAPAANRRLTEYELHKTSYASPGRR